VCLGVQLDILARQIGEAAGELLDLAQRRRVATFEDVEHRLRGVSARIGESDRSGIAEVHPAHPATVSIDHLPRLPACCPDRQRQPRLL
jgi:hypothetical protein